MLLSLFLEVNVSNGSITSKYHKIYIDEYTLNGDFVSSNLIYSIIQTNYNFPWGQYGSIESN